MQKQISRILFLHHNFLTTANYADEIFDAMAAFKDNMLTIFTHKNTQPMLGVLNRLLPPTFVCETYTRIHDIYRAEMIAVVL
jgi:hypothetical protein